VFQPGELAIDRRGLRIVLKSRGDVGVDCGTCNLGHLLAGEERGQVLLDSPFELLRVASVRLVIVNQVAGTSRSRCRRWRCRLRIPSQRKVGARKEKKLKQFKLSSSEMSLLSWARTVISEFGIDSPKVDLIMHGDKETREKGQNPVYPFRWVSIRVQRSGRRADK
jgi:hypothetical protein